MINLITSFYIPKELARQNEILKCLKKNINCKFIKKIYLFIEEKNISFLKEKIINLNQLINEDKIFLILQKKQPTYADYLRTVNKLKKEICMISNSDIWLKSCDEELINILKMNDNIGYSLTRYDSDNFDNIKLYSNGWSNLPEKFIKGNKFNKIGSFDSFILKSPINIDYNLVDHIQNRPGSEHIFKTELEYAGIKFFNTCYDIITVHEHLSNIRTYAKKDDLLHIDRIELDRASLQLDKAVKISKQLYNLSLKIVKDISNGNVLREETKSHKYATNIFNELEIYREMIASNENSTKSSEIYKTYAYAKKITRTPPEHKLKLIQKYLYFSKPINKIYYKEKNIKNYARRGSNNFRRLRLR